MEEVYKGNIFPFCKYVAKEITNKPSVFPLSGVSSGLANSLLWHTIKKKNGNHQLKMIFYKRFNRRLKKSFGKNYILLIIFKLYSSFFLLFCKNPQLITITRYESISIQQMFSSCIKVYVTHLRSEVLLNGPKIIACDRPLV